MNTSLLLLVDGRFPAGGHTNSAGVESAVRLGDVRDETTLERYLHGRLATTGRVDAAFAARMAAHQLQSDDDESRSLLRDLDAELTARMVSGKLRSSSRRLGRQLLRAGRTVWPSELLSQLGAMSPGPHQAQVLGAVVASAGGSPTDAATITLHHLSSAVATSAVRLLGLDPLNIASIQSCAAGLIDELVYMAPMWATTTPAELPANGGSLTEILGEDHGGWDARLFVS